MDFHFPNSLTVQCLCIHEPYTGASWRSPCTLTRSMALLDVSFSHLVQALDFKTVLDVHLNPHCNDDEQFSISSLEVIEKGAFQDERCHNMASMLI